MLCMQIAEVNKALGSVSYLVDRGYKIVFDKCERTGRDLSSMVHKKTEVATRFRRERNVWVLDAYVASNTGSGGGAAEGFSRQGAP